MDNGAHNERQPSCITSRIVIAIDLASQSGLAILAVYGLDPTSCVRNKLARNHLVNNAFDRGGYGNAPGHVHESPNRANWSVSAGRV